MDIVMPGMNGFQATRQLSKDPETSAIPVIVVTTKDQETDRIWATRQGAWRLSDQTRGRRRADRQAGRGARRLTTRPQGAALTAFELLLDIDRRCRLLVADQPPQDTRL